MSEQGNEMQASRRRSVRKAWPVAAFVAIGLVAVALTFEPTTPVAPKAKQGAELVVTQPNGKRVVVDRWEAPADEKMPMRRVSLQWANASNGGYGPSIGGSARHYTVYYWRTWQCTLSLCKTTYTQDYVGGWLFGQVAPYAGAQYLTCPSAGVAPPACEKLGSGHYGNVPSAGFYHGYQWNRTRDTHNVMWQWNYVDNVPILLHWHLSPVGAFAYFILWGEMHMMGDGTMWWDAGGFNVPV